MTSYKDMIDRDELNDLEAILGVVNHDVDATEHIVDRPSADIFTWDYTLARPQLRKLYEKAKTGQWNVETDLDWSIEVDQEHFAKLLSDMRAIQMAEAGITFEGTPFANWGDKEWLAHSMESQNWSLSQFMHGEQGALICTAKIVETVPWIDAKYYAATQVMDEARHVEVFAKYLDTKLSGHYPINAHLQLLLDDIISDSRWDMTYLGMQIMVEGLALAAFGIIAQTSNEPLLRQIVHMIMQDEARHVEVYERYLREKVEKSYPINGSLHTLLDQILSDSRWDMKYLGMQILVEGLALAAFKFIHSFTSEPLIRDLTHHVMRDEARHVAFGVLSLSGYYATLTERERREREEFTYEACRLMRDRFLQREVWDHMGLPVEECVELTLHSPAMREFRRLLFMRVVPNVKRLGLLSPFLRARFEELGILQFENEAPDA